MAWNAGYGIAPSLIFGFLGYTKPFTNKVTEILCPSCLNSLTPTRDTALN